MDQENISVVVADLSIDSLRETGCVPIWSGFGFVELKLNDSQYLQFWHPDLVDGSAKRDIHDHRYEFTAQVLSGELTHQTFDFVETLDGDCELLEVSPEDREGLGDSISRGFSNISGTYNLKQGSVFTFPATGFHSISANRAIVLVARGETISAIKRVILKVGEKAESPLQLEFTEEELWSYIDDLLQPKTSSGYHLQEIEKGVLGEASKIKEEIDEFMDAESQGVSLMSLIELSDVYGAITAFLEQHHPSISMNDLAEMSRVTQRAFQNGHR